MAYQHQIIDQDQALPVGLRHSGVHDYLDVPLGEGRHLTVRIGTIGARLCCYPDPATTERAYRAFTFAQAGAETAWVPNPRELGDGHWLHTFRLPALIAFAEREGRRMLRDIEAGQLLTDRMRQEREDEALAATDHPGVAMTGDDLRARRLALGLTQADLGTRLGKPQNTVARWESGRMAIEAPVMLHLALLAIERGEDAPPADDAGAELAPF